MHFARVKDGKDMLGEKNSFKVLSVGNSFSQDAHSYLYRIAHKMGERYIKIANLYIGGCSLETHYNNALNGLPEYEYQVYESESIKTLGGAAVKHGLENDEWDFITLQQCSAFSGVKNTYLNEHIGFIVETINKYARGGNKLAWHATWAYQSDFMHEAFEKYGYNQAEMYAAIKDAVQSEIVDGGDFDIIIPTVQAVQNLRTSFIGDNVTSDGFHLNFVGCYAAGLMFYKSLTGKKLDSLIDAEDEDFIDKKVLLAVVESVENAYKSPFKTIQSIYI